MTETEKKELKKQCQSFFINNKDIDSLINEYGHLPKAFVKYLYNNQFDGGGALIDWSMDHYIASQFIGSICRKLQEMYPEHYAADLFCGDLHKSYYKIWFNGRKHIKEAANYISSLWNGTDYGQKFCESLNMTYLDGVKPALDVKIEIGSKADVCTYYSLSIFFEHKYIYDEFNNKFILPITPEEKEIVQAKMRETKIYETLKSSNDLKEIEKIIFDEKLKVLYDEHTRRLYTAHSHFYKDIRASLPWIYLMTLDENGDPEKIEDKDQVYKDLDDYFNKCNIS